MYVCVWWGREGDHCNEYTMEVMELCLSIWDAYTVCKYMYIHTCTYIHVHVHTYMYMYMTLSKYSNTGKYVCIYIVCTFLCGHYFANLWQKLTKYFRAGVRFSLMWGMLFRT